MNCLSNISFRFFLILLGIVLLNFSSSFSQEIPFKTIVIDSQMAGDCKLVGDIDSDGFDDLIIGGSIGENLKWYHYPNWTVTEIAVPLFEFTTDAALADMDNDGDLDIIVPDGRGTDNLLIFFNPLPLGNAFNGNEWIRDSVGTIGSTGKDVQIADFDSDGKLDIATRERNVAMIFFQDDSSRWQKVGLSVNSLGSEGMAIGKIDQDADVDLVFRGVWLKNPGGVAARSGTNWIEYNIGVINQAFKALVNDVNEDGKMDVLFSSSEFTDDVSWFTPLTNDPTGPWVENVVVANLNRCHTLQVADMDNDGDKDLVIAQMHTSVAKEVMVYKNLNGAATVWEKQVLATTGVHNAVVADIGNDGDFDIYGSNWTGNSPLRLWENVLSPIDAWQYTEITNSHQRTFGLTFGKVNNDDYADIISGRFWYKNPGDLSIAGWSKTFLPSGMQAALMTDVDNDGLADIIAMKDEVNIAIYWLEATDTSGASWTQLKIGEVVQASHALGSQGHKIGELVGGGKPEIVFSSGGGIYYFEIPANPDIDIWPKIRINSNPSDEGFGIGDIDNDGFVDIAATTGSNKTVEWYKNPGDNSADWNAFQLGTVAEIHFPDRCEVGDLNGDGKLDVAVTEENRDSVNAKTYWWEQPANPMNLNWPRHLLTTQATTHSLALSDIDNDSDLDIITGEHRGQKRVIIWENSDVDTSFVPHVISSNKESHLGTKLYDLNNDGVLEIVSIAWDAPQFIHLWRNDFLVARVAAEILLPSLSIAAMDTAEVPLLVSSDSSLAFAQFVIEFDSTVVEFVSVNLGAAAQGFSILTQTQLPFGSSAGGAQKNILFQISSPSSAVTGINQEVLKIKMKAIGNVGATSALMIDNANTHTILTTNTGIDIPATAIKKTDGIITIVQQPLYNIAGQVKYLNTSRNISAAEITLNNSDGTSTVTSGTGGDYLHPSIKAGTSQLLIKKSGDLRNAITGSDALKLQHFLAFLDVPTEQEFLTSDVNQDSVLTGSDVLAILRYLAFFENNIGLVSEWKFTPRDTSFNLNSNISIDFSGFLLGDVNTNWNFNSNSKETIYQNWSLAIEKDIVKGNSIYEFKASADETDQKIHSLQATIIYDPEHFFFESFVKPHDDDFLAVFNDTEPGKLHVAMSSGKGVMPPNVLFSIHLSPKDQVMDYTEIKISRALLNDIPIIGVGVTSFSEDIVLIPEDFNLGQNYPNPFNPYTEITYNIPALTSDNIKVTLTIFNIRGQRVRTLINAVKTAGYHKISWDGANENGINVPSGIYFYSMNAGNFRAIKKMTLLR